MGMREHARLLLHKALTGETSLDILLASGRAPIETTGLLAQQAAEKLLKAAPRAVGARRPRTHDLERPCDLSRSRGYGAVGGGSCALTSRPFGPSSSPRGEEVPSRARRR